MTETLAGPMGPYTEETRRNYAPLIRVLQDALDRAVFGKGATRHAAGRAFLDQPIMTIQASVGMGFAIGQALKKIDEIPRLPYAYAIEELQDAIIYLAAAVIDLNRNLGVQIG